MKPRPTEEIQAILLFSPSQQLSQRTVYWVLTANKESGITKIWIWHD
jgi:hypothetical protein